MVDPIAIFYQLHLAIIQDIINPNILFWPILLVTFALFLYIPIKPSKTFLLAAFPTIVIAFWSWKIEHINFLLNTNILIKNTFDIGHILIIAVLLIFTFSIAYKDAKNLHIKINPNIKIFILSLWVAFFALNPSFIIYSGMSAWHNFDYYELYPESKIILKITIIFGYYLVYLAIISAAAYAKLILPKIARIILSPMLMLSVLILYFAIHWSKYQFLLSKISISLSISQ